MKRTLSNSFKALVDYFVIMILLGIMAYPFIALAKDNFTNWLPYFLGAFFLMLTILLYTDFKRLAIKEKRPQYELHPKPVNGLIYGLIGEIPLILLTVVGIVFGYIADINPDIQILVQNGVKIVLAPTHIIYKLPSSDILGFTVALLYIPLISMAGYSAGLLGIELRESTKKKYIKIKEKITERFKSDND